jgi:hypothetical protein
MIIVEDIDFAGSFCYPPCEAYKKYCDLYSETVKRRGGDPDIGRRLPALLLEAGLTNVGMHIVQPSALEKDVKQISAVTMENIADAVLEERLATREEIQVIVEELCQRADDPSFAMGVPRLVQAWGSIS